MCKKLGAFIVISLIVIGCGNNRQPKVCDEKIMVIQQYIYDYEFHSHEESLDSALSIVREIKDICPRWGNNIRMREAEIYYLKKDYNSAINKFEEIDGGLPFPELKDIFIKKMKVKQAQINNDTVLINNLYKEIIFDYEKYFNDAKSALKITLRNRNENKVFHSWANTVLVEMFHYKLQLENLNDVLKQIDSLQKAVKGNKEYFDRLKNLFIEDKTYKVFFE